MKKHRVSLIFGLCALIMTALEAATPPVATITWSRTTTYTDGTVIPATVPITYQVYEGAAGAEVIYKTPVSSPPYVLVPTPAAGTSFCVQVTAIAGGVESDRSPEVCSSIPKVNIPATPAAVKLTVQ